METIRRVVLSLFLALFAPLSHSQVSETAPDALLSAITAEVIAVLKQNREAESPARIAELVETRVLPLFDFSRMTQLAAARSWRLASAAQQAALTAEFRTLLVRTYSAALAAYRDQAIVYKPVRLVRGDTDVTVKSEVRQGNGQLHVDYDMVKTPEGWKVYDVKIDRVSLVTAYREGFAAKVRDAGVDGLIRSLAEKNRQGDTPARPAGPIAATSR